MPERMFIRISEWIIKEIMEWNLGTLLDEIYVGVP